MTFDNTHTINNCINCGKIIRNVSIRCRFCYDKYRAIGMYCVDCGKKLKKKSAIRCRQCWLNIKSMDNEKNNNWNQDVGYDGIHSWVRRRKLKPKLCEICKKEIPIDLSNISGKYKRDVNDFQYLCRKCHMTLDGRLEILKKPRKGVTRKDVI